jgi:hypothetical protein
VGSEVHSWDRMFSSTESQWIMHINHDSVTAWTHCYTMDAWTWGMQLMGTRDLEICCSHKGQDRMCVRGGESSACYALRPTWEDNTELS